MPRKEFLRLMDENVAILDRLANRLRLEPSRVPGYPRHLISVLVGLYRGGRARLKDIAQREGLSTPNLCAAFRRLERDGMVSRSVDEDDRRNTWYAVTPHGAEIARDTINRFRVAIASMFAGMDAEDEARMNQSLRTMNEILKKLELK